MYKVKYVDSFDIKEETDRKNIKAQLIEKGDEKTAHNKGVK